MSCPTDLRQWIIDEKLSRLPNNETRGHIPDDLTRYLFAASVRVGDESLPQVS